MRDSRKIIKEEDIELVTGKYKIYVYDNNKIELKKFNKKYDIWVTLRFADQDDTEVIEKVKESTKNTLI